MPQDYHEDAERQAVESTEHLVSPNNGAIIPVLLPSVFPCPLPAFCSPLSSPPPFHSSCFFFPF